MYSGENLPGQDKTCWATTTAEGFVSKTPSVRSNGHKKNQAQFSEYQHTIYHLSHHTNTYTHAHTHEKKEAVELSYRL